MLPAQRGPPWEPRPTAGAFLFFELLGYLEPADRGRCGAPLQGTIQTEEGSAINELVCSAPAITTTH